MTCACYMCHLLECSALQYCCIEDIVSENPIMTVPVTKVACVIQRYARPAQPNNRVYVHTHRFPS